jgi:hypothetical protein
VVGAAELADDARQGRAHDGLVERGQQHGEDDADHGDDFAFGVQVAEGGDVLRLGGGLFQVFSLFYDSSFNGLASFIWAVIF